MYNAIFRYCIFFVSFFLLRFWWKRSCYNEFFFLSWSLTLDQKNNRLSLWDLTIILGKSHPLGRLNLKFCACVLWVSFIHCQWQSVNCMQTTCKFLCWKQFLWLCASSQLFPCSLISMMFQNYGNIYVQYFVTSDRQTVQCIEVDWIFFLV